MKAVVISGSERRFGITSAVSEKTRLCLNDLGVTTKIIYLNEIDFTPCNGCGGFTDLPKEFNVTRYHSLIADRDKFAHSLLQVTAISQLDGYVMALKHPELPIEGVQFHPESITTENGFRLIENFFRYTVNAHYFSSQSGGNCINELPAR